MMLKTRKLYNKCFYQQAGTQTDVMLMHTVRHQGYEEEESVSDAKKAAPRPGSITSQLSATEHGRWTCQAIWSDMASGARNQEYSIFSG